MTSRTVSPCTHELRPGTAICLRCQHAERGAKRARQRQLIARGAIATLALGLVAAAGIAATTAFKARTTGGDPSTLASSAPVSAAAGTIGSGTMATPVDRDSGDVSAPAETLTRAPTSAAGAFAPLVPLGVSQLRDTMVAERAGDTVRVRFDLALARTRRSDKFEAIVRSTLPQVYGAPADSALRALPVGAVARAGDLTTALAEQGFRIPLAGGRTIAVWPETRPGRDGPLVVAYRAVASRE